MTTVERKNARTEQAVRASHADRRGLVTNASGSTRCARCVRSCCASVGRRPRECPRCCLRRGFRFDGCHRAMRGHLRAKSRADERGPFRWSHVGTRCSRCHRCRIRRALARRSGYSDDPTFHGAHPLSSRADLDWAKSFRVSRRKSSGAPSIAAFRNGWDVGSQGFTSHLSR